MNPVYHSLSLSDMTLHLKDNPTVWYANRRGKLLKIDITVDHNKHYFEQFYDYIIFDVYDSVPIETSISLATLFFKRMYKYGHFFSNKNDAVKYIFKRSQLNIKNVPIKALDYINNHPECLL